MIKKATLPKFSHRLFVVLEILFIFFAVDACFFYVFETFFANPAELSLSMGEVALTPGSDPETAVAVDSKAEEIHIKQLRGSLLVKRPSSEFISLVRLYTFPTILLEIGFAIALCDLLRRLFRSVRSGESFSERNIRLVYRIGIAFIVFAVLSSACGAFHEHAVTEYLRHHGLGQGVNLVAAEPNIFFELGSVQAGRQMAFHFNWTGILTGLLILALGEVFRQGLA